jgi:ribosomal protein S18 acetylase RimI-like enzyme
MMEVLETRLLEKGCPKINLQTRNTNIDVVRFYEALGYKVDASILLGKRLIPD